MVKYHNDRIYFHAWKTAKKKNVERIDNRLNSKVNFSRLRVQKIFYIFLLLSSTKFHLSTLVGAKGFSRT